MKIFLIDFFFVFIYLKFVYVFYHYCDYKELVECFYSCFPEQNNEIQQNIKHTELLNFIIFPGKIPINVSKEKNEIFSLLQKDDVDGKIMKLNLMDITIISLIIPLKFHSLIFVVSLVH